MNKLLCRVLKCSNSRIYILSDRVDILDDGDYVIDSINDVYVMTLGYLLPVTTGSCPVGDIFRVEATNHRTLNAKRLTTKFIATAKRSEIQRVTARLRSGKATLQTDQWGRVMVKRYD